MKRIGRIGSRKKKPFLDLSRIRGTGCLKPSWQYDNILIYKYNLLLAIDDVITVLIIIVILRNNNIVNCFHENFRTHRPGIIPTLVGYELYATAGRTGHVLLLSAPTNTATVVWLIYFSGQSNYGFTLLRYSHNISATNGGGA